jgi:hypothetical protein
MYDDFDRTTRRAVLRVLADSGHWPFVDDPSTVARAVTGFLATVPHGELDRRPGADYHRVSEELVATGGRPLP